MLTAGPNVQVALVERFANSVSMNHRQTMTTGNTRSGDNDDDGSSASPAAVVEEPDGGRVGHSIYLGLIGRKSNLSAC